MTHRTSHSRRAFSLIEMLVVMSLIAVLAALVVPAMTTVLQGNHVAQAQQSIQQRLSVARQTAVSKNRRVEVRFYKFDDGDVTGSEQFYRASQMFLVEENNKITPIGKMEKFPGIVVVNESIEASPLLDVPDKTFNATLDPKVSIAGAGTSYSARAFQFRPDGSTNLASGKNFITLHAVRSAAEATTSTLPPNYAVIQVDEISGATRTYRP